MLNSYVSRGIARSGDEDGRWSVRKYWESLFHVLKHQQSTPPFLQLYFLMRLKMKENWHNSFIMLGIAFCGNGFIHLNVAEIHEEDIGDQKTCAPIGDQGSKWANWVTGPMEVVKFVKFFDVLPERPKSKGWVECSSFFQSSHGLVYTVK